MLDKNTSLRPYNTFGIEVSTAYYARFDSVKNLKQLLHQKASLPLFILGGGSNILFTKDYNGIVLKNEILGFLKKPLNDLCISRPKSRLNWGIELPFDSDYVTYVWFDALINYITAPGFLNNITLFNKYWPASMHLIGKDILTTHAVYWPTMLMSAGIELPKTIFAHGWWLMEDEKMSKSTGNVINPMDLIDEYGVDPVRYYLMREMVLGQDANFTIKSFINRYNSDLANDFGNLLSRVSTLINKNYDGEIPELSSLSSNDKKIEESSREVVQNFDNYMSNMAINDAIEEVLQFVRSINKYFEHSVPWKVVKEDKELAGTILYTGAEALRISAVLLSSIMPERTKKLFQVLNTDSRDRKSVSYTHLRAHET